ncbi:MAG TPA: ACT domain-containing protein, partial [Solirubrobacterales bacterium]|nr:ACT domain-containing protein [Solirubrobacterales bacterium]
MRVRGPLDFELTGVLAALAAPLAQTAVSIFAISTFDTDYLLVRADSLARAVEVLRDAGHGVDRPGDEG